MRLLNYLYAVRESEARRAASTLGLDLGLGVLHVDISAIEPTWMDGKSYFSSSDVQDLDVPKRIRHARITEASSYRRELAANLHRQGIGQALGRRRRLELAGIQDNRIQAQGLCYRHRRTIDENRKNTQAGIHAQGNQSAHFGENLQQGTGASS